MSGLRMKRMTVVVRGAVAALLAALGAAPLAAQTIAPPGWRWTTDSPAPLRIAQTATDSSWRFVQMAPGWHITTRPPATMYDPSASASGNYAVESLQILFPGRSQSGYGVFVGGRDLDGNAPGYVAFLMRRDGQFAVERRSGASTDALVPWTASAAVKLATGNGTVSNLMRVSAEPDSVRFSINGERVATLPRGELPLDGHFGFRTGADINLHVTTLDHTRRLAPVPQPAKP